MASRASLIVTPNLFRAVTTTPCWKWRSIALTRGVIMGFFNMSFSSTVVGDVFIFLFRKIDVSAGKTDKLRYKGQYKRFYHPVPCVSFATTIGVLLSSITD